MITWNPWYGCHKCSPGCKNCYVETWNKLYEKDFDDVKYSSSNFRLPWKKDEYRDFVIESGETVLVCETSDFFIEEGDDYRAEAWKMIKDRDDLTFIINTRRVDRIEDELPSDWGDGYKNVIIVANVENQEMADLKLPIYKEISMVNKAINISPILEKVDISKYLDSSILYVGVSGEHGRGARDCNFDWVLDLQRQCNEKQIPINFNSTGTNFVKDGKKYFVKNNQMKDQAEKSGIK